MCLIHTLAGKPTNRRRTIQKRDSIIIPRRLTPCEIRARCVEELITTEAQYVEHLGNIIEVSHVTQCNLIEVSHVTSGVT